VSETENNREGEKKVRVRERKRGLKEKVENMRKKGGR